VIECNGLIEKVCVMMVVQLCSLRGKMRGYLWTLVNRRERGLDIWLSSNRLERGKERWW
jgi:hypothetical protein